MSLPVAIRFNTRATLLSTAILAAAVTLGALGLPAWHEQGRTAPRSSIIVMPFKNLSGDATQDYFADAVTDDLTTDLSRLPGAFVIAPGTAFTYKGKAVDTRQVGEECGVRYLLEGSINRIDTRLRTNVRLIDTASAGNFGPTGSRKK
jgi:TolB-like protein